MIYLLFFMKSYLYFIPRKHYYDNLALNNFYTTLIHIFLMQSYVLILLIAHLTFNYLIIPILINISDVNDILIS